MHAPHCPITHSGTELYLQYNPEVINQIKANTNFTPLHVTAQLDIYDILCYLASMVHNSCMVLVEVTKQVICMKRACFTNDYLLCIYWEHNKALPE